MSAYKLTFYCSILAILLWGQLPDDYLTGIFFVYIALLFVDANDSNTKSLIVIIAIFQLLFFELDWLFYVLGKYYWNTGPIVGDVILNAVVLINFLGLIACIFYRSEIMRSATSLFKIKKFVYLPTKADVIQINVIRIIALYHIAYFLQSAWVVHEMNQLTDSINYGHIYKNLDNTLLEMGHRYLEVGKNLELLRHATLLYVVHISIKKGVSEGKVKIETISGWKHWHQSLSKPLRILQVFTLFSALISGIFYYTTNDEITRLFQVGTAFTFRMSLLIIILFVADRYRISATD